MLCPVLNCNDTFRCSIQPRLFLDLFDSIFSNRHIHIIPTEQVSSFGV